MRPLIIIKSTIRNNPQENDRSNKDKTMRALLIHSRKYQVKITGLATRPILIKPEQVIEPEQTCNNCVVAFISIENGDTIDFANKMVVEIKNMIEETKHNNVVVTPFAHLSSNLASSDLALELLRVITDNLKQFNLTRTHFGSDKELLLDVFGHPGNFRFREFK